MRWTIEFGGDPQDATVTTSGEATPEGFAQMNAELFGDERFRPGMLVLLDHTDLAVGGLTSEDVRTIAADFTRHEGAPVVAIVTPKPLQFGLARMSTTLVDAEPRLRVFGTRDAALAWLHQVREGGTGATA